MAWVSVNNDGSEFVSSSEPHKMQEYGRYACVYGGVELPKGSIKKLIGRELKWSDNPVELH